MSRRRCSWIVFVIFMIVVSACTAVSKGTPTMAGQRSYTNGEYQFSIAYPSDWTIESEGYQLVILVPRAARSWRPSTPSEIPRDPHVTILMGEYIREKLGPAYFPGVVDSDSLRAWLTQKAEHGEARDLSELTINGVQALVVTEIYEPGCERVVYWRLEGLEKLIRVSTGCESAYLTAFNQIVNSLRQME